MHQTIVRMKDGRIFEGKLCYWSPLTGYIAVEGTSGKTTIWLNAVAAARTGKQDELARARDDGWKPTNTVAAFNESHTASDFR